MPTIQLEASSAGMLINSINRILKEPLKKRHSAPFTQLAKALKSLGILPKESKLVNYIGLAARPDGTLVLIVTHDEPNATMVGPVAPDLGRTA